MFMREDQSASDTSKSKVQMRFPKIWLVSKSALLVLVLLPFLAGCGRFRPLPKTEYVYVMVKQTFLRDRVAAVSNRIAPVVNGQRLEVLEKGRRFLRVKDEKGDIGWIEERAVIDGTVYQGFQDLVQAHAKDPVVATASLRDDLYVHLKPGRDTTKFYLLPENEKLQLLIRASVPKPESAWGNLPKPIATPPPSKKVPPAKLAKPGTAANDKTAPATAATPDVPPPPPPALEDWWLARDSKGRAGWILARRLDVDQPDAIAAYAEGQKIVGAYVLTTVEDSEATTPDKQVPEYVAVLNSYENGLPYDFNQVRVFSWNTKKHRYETAYRQRNLTAYLPVEVGSKSFDGQPAVPFFSFRQAVNGDASIDPATGVATPAQTETLTYRMDGVMVKRVLPAGEKSAPIASSNKSAKSIKTADHRARHAKNRRAQH
jgi:SH3-like domain-containing protein